MWHVRARDPAWLVLIAAVRRAYWWSPLVAHLAREAVLMIESACDHRCTAVVDKRSYMRALASLLIAGPAPMPRLLATARAPNLDVQRLRLLDATLRLRARDVALLAALGAAGTAAAAGAIVERAAPPRDLRAPHLEAPGDGLPATPAGRALGTLLRAVNGGNAELVNEMLAAYTPQEVALPLPHAAAKSRIVDVLQSEPLRIEYVVESVGSRTRYVGAIAIAESRPGNISESRLAEQDRNSALAP
jgi:hypothetical protein